MINKFTSVPAYDEYFKNGVAKYYITIKFLSKSSLIGLAEYYTENNKELEDVRNSISQTRNLMIGRLTSTEWEIH